MTPKLTISRVNLEILPQRGSSHEYIAHQLVADLFGDRDDRGYLYRVTRQSRDGRETQVLTLSRDVPTERVPERSWGRIRSVEHKPFAPIIHVGDLLDYEVRINATTVVTEESGRKRRTDVWDSVFSANRDDPRTPHDVYGAYLGRKLEGAAELLDCRVTERGQVRVRRAGSRQPITFIATNLIGTLRVLDPEALVVTVGEGVGRAKAFGCGLICLSRPGTILPRRSVTETI